MRAGTVVAGRFELVSLAGRGGMGSVYRAIDRTSGGVVAVKVLRDVDADMTARFALEIRTVAALSHPGIVRYVAHGVVDEGAPFLAMEWVEGEDLGHRLRRGSLSPNEAVRLVGAVAEALGAAHRRGIIHRDLKPTNILLVDGNVASPKLLDFGIARVASAERGLTLTGVVLGTPGYLSPEQARGERDVDARADVFALGCLLFRCLTGRLPFVADEPVASLLKVVLEEPPRVRELAPRVSVELDAFVARLLEKRRENRPMNASLVAEALALFDEPVEATRRDLSRPSGVLGGTEQRSLCLLLVRLAGADERSRESAPEVEPDSLLPTRRGEAIEPVRRLLAPLGGRLDVLADGSLLVTFASGSALADDVRAAARAALALTALLGPRPMALVTGRGVVAGRLPVGSVVDRAVKLVAEGPAIHLDPGARELLEQGFEVSSEGTLLGARGDPEEQGGVRTLLGRATPCVGRERDLAILQGYFDECATESLSRVVLVTAPAGFGKTRLRHEVIGALRRRGEPFELWVGRGEPTSAGAPFALVADALGRAAGLRDGEPPALRHERLRQRVARSLAGREAARASVFLGELLGAPAPDGGVELAAARRDAMLMGDRIRRAFEELVAAECARQPLVLVLEDLHWGDRSSVDLVDGALAALPNAPFLVVGFARPEVHDVLPRLFAERHVHELRLAPLSPRAAEKLVRRVLGDDVDDDKVRRLVEQAAGNAFFLEELIRMVADGRDGELPGSVLAMLEGRLAALDPGARRVLRAASVFGKVFWRGGVEALLGEGELGARVGEQLAHLTTQELVVRRVDPAFVDEEELAFRHALVRDAAYAMLTAEDRVLGHRLAGSWLEAMGEPDPALLAAHFEQGQDPARALVRYQRAAGLALEGNDFDAALVQVERGLRCAEAAGSGHDGAVGGLHLAAAEAHRWRAEMSQAEASGKAALALLPRGSAAHYRALTEAIVGAARRAERETIARLADEVLATAATGEAEVLRQVAAARAAVALAHAGDGTRVARILTWLGSIVEAPDADPIATAWTHRARATGALRDGDPGAYVDHLHLAATAFERAGDLRNAANQYSNLGFGYIEVGAHAEAVRVLRKTITQAARLRLSYVTLLAKHNLGLALLHQGQWDEARALEREAAEALAAQGYPLLGGAARTYLALAHLGAGVPSEALEEARRAQQILPQGKPAQAFALAVESAARLALGDVAGALDRALHAMSWTADEGAVDEGESLVRLVHARALFASGDRAGARHAIGLARARLLERAARIQTDSHRRGFLETVPENAMTLTLAAQWLADEGASP